MGACDCLVLRYLKRGLLPRIILLAGLYPLHQVHSGLKARIETPSIHHEAPT